MIIKSIACWRLPRGLTPEYFSRFINEKLQREQKAIKSNRLASIENKWNSYACSNGWETEGQRCGCSWVLRWRLHAPALWVIRTFLINAVTMNTCKHIVFNCIQTESSSPSFLQVHISQVSANHDQTIWHVLRDRQRDCCWKYWIYIQIKYLNLDLLALPLAVISLHSRPIWIKNIELKLNWAVIHAIALINLFIYLKYFDVIITKFYTYSLEYTVWNWIWIPLRRTAHLLAEASVLTEGCYFNYSNVVADWTGAGVTRCSGFFHLYAVRHQHCCYIMCRATSLLHNKQVAGK